MKELIDIQSKLNAPKGQFNKFGNFHYRSCEDILSALKPLLKEQKCTLTLTDDIVMIGTRIYVKANAVLTNEKGETVSTAALAREEETKKGMDGSQITGSSSSYARKYALNGLFAIDDTKDADTRDNTVSTDIGIDEKFNNYVVPAIQQARSKDELKKIYNTYADMRQYAPFINALSEKRKSFEQ